MKPSKLSQEELEGRIRELEKKIAVLQEIEKKSTKSQRNLKEAEELAKLGHWELDLGRNTLYWSDEIYRIFDLRPQEFGASYEAFLDTVHPDDRDFVNKTYTDSVKNRTPYNIVHRLLLKNGAIKYVNERCRTEYANDGTPLSSLGTVLDITDRIRMEEELLKIKKLESIGLLAGGIAHDFNNLLAGILGNISLTNQLLGNTNSTASNLLEEAEKASLRAKDLTQQLVTFSKGGEPIKSKINIGKIIKNSTKFVLSGSNVKCVFDVPDDLAIIEADAVQISQVIQNIVLNASQAMPEGGAINISCKNFLKTSKDFIPLHDGNYVKITVEDYGVGIPEKYIEKIFDPYFTTKQHCSGLGLTIAHSIVSKHGGHITVYSKPGIKTTCEFFLASIGKPKLSVKTDDGSISYGSGRILVMDDEESIRNILQNILSYLGYEVICAKDGLETITLYGQGVKTGNPFDIVIMDLTIPGGHGGKGSISKLLEIDPKVKAIVSSGYSDDPVMANCQDYGFKAFILKPYQLEELCKVIQKVMNE